jgi:predicted Fe-Mo cluster-binding NifX family protein
MIAIPLGQKDATTISDLYGNAPYFAMLDMNSGEFNVVKNKGRCDGEDTAQFIIDSGVTSTLFYHMGEGLFKLLDEKNIAVYSVSKVYVTLEDIYSDFYKKGYKKVTKDNLSLLLDAGNCTCKNK